VSNLYPPHFVGGYELGCHDVVEALRRRGHDVHVLTSTRGAREPGASRHVHRLLRVNIRPSGNLLSEGVRLLTKETLNQSRFRHLLAALKPQAVHIWNLWGASVSLPLLAQRTGHPVGFFVSDNWLAQWETDPWYRLWNGPVPARVAVVRPLLRPLVRALGLVTAGSLDLHDIQFTSRFLLRQFRDAGKHVTRPRTVHWGVDTDQYVYRAEPRAPRRLLYVGQVVPHKGLHLAVEAVAATLAAFPHIPLSLTVAGGTIRPDYLTTVQRQVQHLGIRERIDFLGGLPRARMAALYREHDVLLCPSVWDEPFSITVLEAMASGLAVVASATGGTPEAVRDEHNGLLFPRNDSVACARAVGRLLLDHALFERIRANARHTVETEFPISRTVDRVEDALGDLVARPAFTV
jgi:glycogen synthase